MDMHPASIPSRAAIGCLTLCAVLALHACSQTDAAPEGDPPPTDEMPVEIAVHGGQSGVEGGGPTCESVEALAFEPQAVIDLVEGSHETTLAHTPWWQTLEPEAAGDATPLEIEIAVRGEPRIDL